MKTRRSTWLAAVLVACAGADRPPPTAPPPPPPAEAPIENQASPTSRRQVLAWDPEERLYIDDLLSALRTTGERERVPRLVQFADEVTALVERAERGAVDEEELLRELAGHEEALDKAIGDQRARAVRDDLSTQLDDLREVCRRARVIPATD